MASFRLPGPVCKFLGAYGIDLGTLCRSASPVPGSIVIEPVVQMSATGHQTQISMEGLTDACFVKQAMKNANDNLHKREGDVTWNSITLHGVWAGVDDTGKKMTYCARFVRMCYGKSPVYTDAISMYASLNSKVAISTDANPPEGAVVFYAKNSDENWNCGHVGIADGKGSAYSVVNISIGVDLKLVTNAFKANYLGYLSAQEFMNNY
jgi:hypothetical protein